MNTVTPYPTLTPFPTPAGTPMVNLAPVQSALAAGEFGPQAVQFWQMSVGPHWALISSFVLFVLVMVAFFSFYRVLKAEE